MKRFHVSSSCPLKEVSGSQWEVNGDKDIDAVAKEVIDGLWGTGDERKRKLKTAGYDYYAVQRRVNEMLR